jgi:diguanylate cyclase (GGDEF)-like protein/PAS domain S-box-containing protein
MDPMTRLSMVLPPHSGDWSPAVLRAALDLASDAILFVAPHSGRLIDANQAACQALDYSHAELMQMRLGDVAPAAADGQLVSVVERVVQDEMQQATVRSALRRSNGTEFPVVASLCRVDSEGDSYLVLVASEVEAHGRSVVAESQPLVCDPLTGLPCRTELERRLESQARKARESDGRFAVLFIDIDCFKQVNDTMGHLVGDEVLKTVAQRLTACLRPTDVAVRFGGDEFVAVAASIRCVDDVIRVAERIQQAMSETIHAGGREVTVSASIGIAMASGGNEQEPRQLIDAADQAMYRAKARGRHGFYEVHCGRKNCGYSQAQSLPCENSAATLNVVPLGQSTPPMMHRLPR